MKLTDKEFEDFENEVCKKNLRSVDVHKISFYYTKIFSKELKAGCGTCIDEAYYELLKYRKSIYTHKRSDLSSRIAELKYKYESANENIARWCAKRILELESELQLLV